MDCGLNTGYVGDSECIKPPPADKGYQLHIGPSNYTNPEAQYVLQPGQEMTSDFPATSTNSTQMYFFYRQYRLRPTTHHAIITAGNGSAVLGRRIATANHSGEYPTGGIAAPEDQDVGIPLAAHSAINVSFHRINTTPKPQLTELWINFWYKDASTVKEPATEWFNIGSAVFSIPPHSKGTIGPSTCSVSGTGRLLWLYGHRHANNTRFTVTRIRGTQRDIIYDANVWEEPLLLNYNSITTNVKPDLATGGMTEGGWSGPLDMKTGDRVEWVCQVDNQHDTPLSFTEQTYLGEMCIVDAEGVGATCN